MGASIAFSAATLLDRPRGAAGRAAHVFGLEYLRLFSTFSSRGQERPLVFESERHQVCSLRWQVFHPSTQTYLLFYVTTILELGPGITIPSPN